jgi:hypothetical protein
MGDFVFSRFREIDSLTFPQESARREAARKKVRHTRVGGSRAVKQARCGEAGRPRRPPAPAAPNSTRAFVPWDAELFELESLREQKFILQSEIADVLSEVNPLRANMRELEQRQAEIHAENRYCVEHFADEAPETGVAVRQRECEQAVLRLQRETSGLRSRIEELLREISDQRIRDLLIEIGRANRVIHQMTEDCDELGRQADANVRRAEAFRISTLFEEVQENKQKLEDLQAELKNEMAKHNKLKKAYLLATSDVDRPAVDAAQPIIELKNRLKREQDIFHERHRILLEQKEQQIQEIRELKCERKERPANQSALRRREEKRSDRVQIIEDANRPPVFETEKTEKTSTSDLETTDRMLSMSEQTQSADESAEEGRRVEAAQEAPEPSAPAGDGDEKQAPVAMEEDSNEVMPGASEEQEPAADAALPEPEAQAESRALPSELTEPDGPADPLGDTGNTEIPAEEIGQLEPPENEEQNSAAVAEIIQTESTEDGRPCDASPLVTDERHDSEREIPPEEAPPNGQDGLLFDNSEDGAALTAATVPDGSAFAFSADAGPASETEIPADEAPPPEPPAPTGDTPGDCSLDHGAGDVPPADAALADATDDPGAPDGILPSPADVEAGQPASGEAHSDGPAAALDAPDESRDEPASGARDERAEGPEEESTGEQNHAVRIESGADAGAGAKGNSRDGETEESSTSVEGGSNDGEAGSLADDSGDGS